VTGKAPAAASRFRRRRLQTRKVVFQAHLLQGFRPSRGRAARNIVARARRAGTLRTLGSIGGRRQSRPAAAAVIGVSMVGQGALADGLIRCCSGSNGHITFAPALYRSPAVRHAKGTWPPISTRGNPNHSCLAVHPSLPARSGPRNSSPLRRRKPPAANHVRPRAGRRRRRVPSRHRIGCRSRPAFRWCMCPYKGTGPGMTALLSGEVQGSRSSVLRPSCRISRPAKSRRTRGDPATKRFASRARPADDQRKPAVPGLRIRRVVRTPVHWAARRATSSPKRTPRSRARGPEVACPSRNAMPSAGLEPVNLRRPKNSRPR